MKRLLNRTISLVLVAVVVAAFTACGGSAAPVSSRPTPQSATSTSRSESIGIPAISTPVDSSLSESETPDMSENPLAQIAGKYIQPDDPDRWLSENAKPYLILNEDGSSQFFENMLSTFCLADGTYTIEDNRVHITLTSSKPDGMLTDTPNMGIAFNHYFTIVDVDTLAIDESVYATQAGDIFVREYNPLGGLW